VQAVECCDTGGDRQLQVQQLAKLRQYGELLFEAAFGETTWQRILTDVAAGADYLEVAVRGAADGDHRALQALRWEALHDGTGFIVAQGATYDKDRSIPVGVVRVITPSASAPKDAIPDSWGPGDAELVQITHIPKVLFAVGSHLTDPQVRPGAEFMGIMRRLDRNGGSIRARVLESATRWRLVEELTAFKPDVLHLIGHGRLSVDGQVTVQLRGDPSGDHYVSAEELLAAFAEAGHRPTMVVLSACQTGAAGGGLSFAARLVAGNGVSRGVSIVVAMAGDISDTACRIFTQALTTAIGVGVPLGKAVVRGRRAAFYNARGRDAQHPAPDSGHWVMPVLFLADFVRDDIPLVQMDSVKAARKRVELLNLAYEPVFFGRPEFLTALDRLLDADDNLKVLVAHTPNAAKSYGSTRLLRELGARAVRSDVLPVFLGPFDNDRPDCLRKLAKEFEERINEIRSHLLNLNMWYPSEAVAAVENGAVGLVLAKAIRRDLDALVAALPADDPVRHRAAGQPRTILLCHRVDMWTGVIDKLLDLLGPVGLDGGATPVPVVLTGAENDDALKGVLEGRRFGGAHWIDFVPLRRLRGDRDEDDGGMGGAPRNEDVLAYQWWLLNPPEALDGRQLAFAPRRGAPDDWKNAIRTTLRRLNCMYDEVIYDLAAGSSSLVSASDDYLLESYAKVLP
jgi:hypothetical protein